MPWIVENSLETAFRDLLSVQKDVAAQCVNNAAFEIRRVEQQHLAQVFDRPTPAFINAVVVKKADPGSSKIEATVMFDATDPAFKARLDEITKIQEDGNTESASMMNRATLNVPTAATLNQYGGMPLSYLPKLLQGKPAKRRKKGTVPPQFVGNAFEATIGGIDGVWLHIGTMQVLIAEYEKQINYMPRMGFETTADAVAPYALQVSFGKALKSALKNGAIYTES